MYGLGLVGPVGPVLCRSNEKQTISRSGVEDATSIGCPPNELASKSTKIGSVPQLRGSPARSAGFQIHGPRRASMWHGQEPPMRRGRDGPRSLAERGVPIEVVQPTSVPAPSVTYSQEVAASAALNFTDLAIGSGASDPRGRHSSTTQSPASHATRSRTTHRCAARARPLSGPVRDRAPPTCRPGRRVR